MRLCWGLVGKQDVLHEASMREPRIRGLFNSKGMDDVLNSSHGYESKNLRNMVGVCRFKPRVRITSNKHLVLGSKGGYELETHVLDLSRTSIIYATSSPYKYRQSIF